MNGQRRLSDFSIAAEVQLGKARERESDSEGESGQAHRLHTRWRAGRKRAREHMECSHHSKLLQWSEEGGHA